MKKIIAEELKEKLAAHALWLETRNSENPDNPQGEQLDLRGYDLRKHTRLLRGRDLQFARFEGSLLAGGVVWKDDDYKDVFRMLRGA